MKRESRRRTTHAFISTCEFLQVYRGIMDAIFAYTKSDEQDFYSILGCNDSSSVEQIITEYKIRALECHPDKHRDDPGAGEKFARLQKAKATLVDPEKRRDYDTWRNSGLAIPYEGWLAKRAAIHTSMHWAVKTQNEPMLENFPSTRSETSQDSHEHQWVNWDNWSTSDHVRKFRNYEI